jgi:hypothetical protein
MRERVFLEKKKKSTPPHSRQSPGRGENILKVFCFSCSEDNGFWKYFIFSIYCRVGSCVVGDREGFVLVFINSVGCAHVVVFMNSYFGNTLSLLLPGC